MSKQCPQHQILNPSTNRCVNRDGVIGKKILSGSIVNNNERIKHLITKDCPTGQIRNPATGRCVNKDGVIGKKILKNINIPVSNQTIIQNIPITRHNTNQSISISRQNSLPDAPATKKNQWKFKNLKYLQIPRPKTLDKQTKKTSSQLKFNNINNIATKLISKSILFDRGITTKNCSKNINYKIDQCECPMCWIVSSIVAIKFSNLHKYMAPEYKKFVNDTYNTFSGKSPDITKCPRIPKKIADEYIALYESKRGVLSSKNRENLLISNGGYTTEFMISVLRVGLKNPYTAILRENINTRYPNNMVVVNIEELDDFVDLEDANILLNVLNVFRQKFYKIGYVFTSGRVKIFKNGENNHSVAFTTCKNKYYICNSYDVPCIEIKNSDMFHTEITPLGSVIEITFILIPFSK